MQAAILRVKEAKALLTSARLSYLPSLALAPQGSLTSVDKSTPVKNYTYLLLQVGKLICSANC